ncbi:MAG: hypothetical protein JWP85_981 [Rhodoglobus sp.]|nr:hypothetical protein [Rhodoglobus sp.]
MNKLETGKILTYAATWDRWMTVDDLTVAAWHDQLRDVEFEPASEAVRAFYRSWDGKQPLTVKYVINNAISSAEEIARDVRYARARQLVSYDHLDTEPLPEAIGARVRELKAEAREYFERNKGWMIGA